MLQFDGVINLLDSRSFASIWFWLLLIGMWSATGRNVLGVPAEVLLRARRATRAWHPRAPEVLALLDWLSLVLPRWVLRRTEGAIFLGVTAFLMTSLAIMGFRFGLEMAQALVLLLAPFLILFWLRVHLARQLNPLLEEAAALPLTAFTPDEDGGEDPAQRIAADVVSRMILHRQLVLILSILSVMVTAGFGTVWTLTQGGAFPGR